MGGRIRRECRRRRPRGWTPSAPSPFPIRSPERRVPCVGKRGLAVSRSLVTGTDNGIRARRRCAVVVQESSCRCKTTALRVSVITQSRPRKESSHLRELPPQRSAPACVRLVLSDSESSWGQRARTRSPWGTAVGAAVSRPRRSVVVCRVRPEASVEIGGDDRGVEGRRESTRPLQSR